jgi:hypothetical protein
LDSGVGGAIGITQGGKESENEEMVNRIKCRN